MSDELRGKVEKIFENHLNCGMPVGFIDEILALIEPMTKGAKN